MGVRDRWLGWSATQRQARLHRHSTLNELRYHWGSGGWCPDNNSKELQIHILKSPSLRLWGIRQGQIATRNDFNIISTALGPTPMSSKRTKPNSRFIACFGKGMWRGDRDSNPGNACTSNGFQDRRIRPLCHLPTLQNLSNPKQRLNCESTMLLLGSMRLCKQESSWRFDFARW